jgi:hypothetical protein
LPALASVSGVGLLDRERPWGTIGYYTHLWSEHKQQDGSISTQITANVLIKNLTDKSLGLSSVRLLRPAIDAPLIMGWPLIKERGSPYSSTTMGTGNFLTFFNKIGILRKKYAFRDLPPIESIKKRDSF